MNSAIMRHRWPGLYQDLLKNSQLTPLEITWSDTPEPTLVVDKIQLESGFDKTREARIQAQLIPGKTNSAWLYGLGTGVLAAELLQRRNLTELNIVLLNRQLAAHILRAIPLPFLEDPRVNLIDGSTLTRVRGPFAALPGCLRLADEQCARLRDMILLELSTPYIQEQHNRKMAGRIRARVKENRQFHQNDRPVSELFGQKEGCHVLVAAAGPTLDLTLAKLAELREKAVLISVDAALIPLLRAGIAPDYTVTIDPLPEICTFFATDLTPVRDKALIYFPSVSPEVLRRWPGRRYVAWSEYLARLASSRNTSQMQLFSAGSVIHPAVDLAVRMGAATITLFGADFAYPFGRTHATGCSQSEKFCQAHAGHTLINGHGNQVATTPNLRGYLRDLETYMEQITNHRIIWQNASRDGALIQGCSFLDMDSYLPATVCPMNNAGQSRETKSS